MGVDTKLDQVGHKYIGTDCGAILGITLKDLARTYKDASDIITTCKDKDHCKQLLRMVHQDGISGSEAVAFLIEDKGIEFIYSEASDWMINRYEIEDPADPQGVIDTLAIPLIEFQINNPTLSFNDVVLLAVSLFQKYVHYTIEATDLTVFEGLAYLIG